MFAIAGACGALLALASPAKAADYPERYIKIVSVTGPGSPLDDYTRRLAKFLGQRLGQSVVVENRPGASMIIAADAVAKSAPDGYTLLLTSSSPMSANPYLFKSLPYNPAKDFAPVARLQSMAIALVVPGSSPYKSVADLVAAGRARPGTLNSATVSTGYRVMLSAFHRASGIEAVSVPYKSSATLMPDLMTGVVDYSLMEFSYVLPHIQSGKLRALALLSPSRLPLVPNVPTLAETGMQDAAVVSGISRVNWVGLFAPTGTPAPILKKLESLSMEFAGSSEAQAYTASHGSVANPGTGAELGKSVVADQLLWKQMISAAGLQPE